MLKNCLIFKNIIKNLNKLQLFQRKKDKWKVHIGTFKYES
jgi:hypothetical protein